MSAKTTTKKVTKKPTTKITKKEKIAAAKPTPVKKTEGAKTTPIKMGRKLPIANKVTDWFLKNYKPIGLFSIGLIIGVAIMFVSQYGNIAKLKDGTELVASITGLKIDADELYKELKDANGVSAILSQTDKFILEDKYSDKAADAQKYADDNITSLQSQYSDSWADFLSYYGFADNDALKASLVNQYYANLVTEAYVKKSITDAEINSYYKSDIVGDIKASHILIKADYEDDASDEEIAAAEEKAKATAEDLIKQLDASDDATALFKTLAKKYSDDTASASDSGDLGWFNKGEMAAEFETAAYALKSVGEYTAEPVKTTYGYHIIIKTAKTKDKDKLADVEDEIIATLVSTKVGSDSTLVIKAMMALREKYKLTFEEPSMKTAYDELMASTIATAKAKDEEAAATTE